MAASFVASTDSGTTTSSDSQTVTVPSGVAAGDVAVLFLSRWASFPTPTGPSGSVARAPVEATMSGDNDIEARTFLLYLDGSETELTVSWGGGAWSSLAAQFWTGVDPALDLAAVPLDTAVISAYGPVPDVSVTAPAGSALAHDVNNSAEGDFGAVTHTPPPGYTEVYDYTVNAGSYAVAASGGTQTASGAAYSDSGSGYGCIATLVALPPAGGTPEHRSGSIVLTASAAFDTVAARTGAGAIDLDAASALDPAATRQGAGGIDLPATADLLASGVASEAGHSSATITLAAGAGLGVAGARGGAGSVLLPAVAEPPGMEGRHHGHGGIVIGGHGDFDAGPAAPPRDWTGTLAATASHDDYAATAAQPAYGAAGVPAYAGAATLDEYAATTDRS